MSWTPDVTVATLVERDGRFLVVEERIRGRLMLNQPAGHLEPDESLAAAAVRETREETGCLIEPLWLVGVYQWTPPGRQRGTLRFAFAGRFLHHDAAQPLDAPVVAAHWLRREELMARRAEWRTPMVGRCLDDYLGGRRIDLSALAEVGGGDLSPS